MPLGMEVGLGPLAQATLCSMGTQLSPEIRAHPPDPIFGPCPLWPSGWMDQYTTWYGGKPRPRRHCVRWGRSAPLKGHSPQFLVHVYCGQMAGWMTIPLGTEVDLGPGHIDGVPALRERAQQPPSLFGPYLLWPRSPISATAELLYVMHLISYVNDQREVKLIFA